MHGRVRVRRTEEQERLRKEQQQKLHHHLRDALDSIHACRMQKLYTDAQLVSISSIIEFATEMTTLWNYRREIYEHVFMGLNYSDADVNRVMNTELDLINRCLVKFPKSYALWHHRTWVMKMHRNPPWEEEITFCNTALSLDERNFHCWDYRRFVVAHGKISTNAELAFTDRAIETNMSNYSAWHYRGELLSSSDPLIESSLPVSPPPSKLFNGSWEDGTITLPQPELELVHNAVYTDPKDQSPWSYYWRLLGRGKRRAYLRDLYLSRSLARIMLVFTAARPYSAVQQLDVSVTISGQSLTEGSIYLSPMDLNDWQSALSESVSSVWWLSISTETLAAHLPVSSTSVSDELQISVRVCIKDIDNSGELKGCQNTSCPIDHLFCYECVLEPHQTESLMRVDLDPKRLLNHVISPTNEPQTLVDELHSVRELLTMEPDNKWALRTYVSLLRFVNAPGSDTEVKSTLSELKVVDSTHANQYSTMAESYAMQDILMKVYQADERQVSLQDLSLTGFLHTEWFALMTKIDLSNNSVSKIPDTFAYLLCLRELIMDDNQLSTLNGVRCIPSLLILSVKRNLLRTFSAIEDSLFCPKIQNVSLDGNEVTKIRDLTELLAEHPQSKNKSHSFVVTYAKPFDI